MSLKIIYSSLPAYLPEVSELSGYNELLHVYTNKHGFSVAIAFVKRYTDIDSDVITMA